MKIIVSEKDSTSIKIYIPTCIALNRAVASIAAIVLKKNGVKIKRREIVAIFKVLKRYKYHHRNFNLVEVYDSDGDYVLIKL